jgi:hypothetical protein
MREQSMHEQNKSVLLAISLLLLSMAFVAALSLYSGINAAKTVIAAGNVSTADFDIGTVVMVAANQKIDNFLVLGIEQDSVNGLTYVLYPVTSMTGNQKTISVGDTVGYACDGTLAELTMINGTTAAFTVLVSKPQPYGCPI